MNVEFRDLVEPSVGIEVNNHQYKICKKITVVQQHCKDQIGS